jgi:hypothetical protein
MKEKAMRFNLTKKICKIDMRKRKAQRLAGSMRRRRAIFSRQRKVTHDWKVPKGVTSIRVRVIGGGGGGGRGAMGVQLMGLTPGEKYTIGVGGFDAPDA